MRISDWSSDVCSSDLQQDMARVAGGREVAGHGDEGGDAARQAADQQDQRDGSLDLDLPQPAQPPLPQRRRRRTPPRRLAVFGRLALVGPLYICHRLFKAPNHLDVQVPDPLPAGVAVHAQRSEEHTSELQSLMRKSYAVFCVKKNTKSMTTLIYHIHH